ncbi:MAG: hypothetical protein PHD72_04700 [Patescibacteria group bacterium]|nr:hypothetical protein [Patescibacteria group bacterium]
MARERSLAALFHQAGEDESFGSAIELYDLHKIAEEKDREKEIGDTVKHLEKILADIDNIRLEKTDARQQDILEKQKDTARDLLNSVIERAIEYLGVTMQTGEYKYGRGRMNQKDYLEGLKKIDMTRERKHNLLIDAVNIANRYIVMHFSRLRNSDLDTFLEKEADEGREAIDVERINFPSSGICTPGVNLRNRKSIASWAHALTSELSDYKKISGKDYAFPPQDGDDEKRG